MTLTDDKFFDEVIVSNTEYTTDPTFRFSFRATAIMITCDGEGPIEFSYNGRKRHGKIYQADKFAVFDEQDESIIWLRLAPGGVTTNVRVWAWLKQK